MLYIVNCAHFILKIGTSGDSSTGLGFKILRRLLVLFGLLFQFLDSAEELLDLLVVEIETVQSLL